ncbi:acetyl-CoA carboxylase subunit A [Campylobacter jejuni]|uniref:acetyl-CoA carboxylase subunit A n=1 Tax=Campylobacter jejuni TaxID=197 RepID=UPI0005C40FDC|nr:acetyl-CoA carboxylase subunit A [Campylobacter jejuni]AJP35479.1 2-oxoglutarate carboxylase small subunit [Campylobacter jejuni subsp. jejuni]AQX69429.1 acetyl-CoA carboxylase biotin carboxylase subunit [Campylobacter jejuni]AQY74834.1 acetyl-CoA carboxylase biotin carboxylase subunit [Campylobacter jejuni subsp. jejuni]AWB37375.1 pyruvate carboxylase, subunit A [Campylobacter jejuni]ECO2974548.1 acetyl-CoA carboxylase subunit A [Campylobacter jejuni]
MNQIHKILIANRAEIAVRVIRACRDLHIKSVAVFTEPDHECLHVKIADEAYRIGTDAIRGYLDVARIVEIAKACGADAIHPGYGFLSENYEFAKACEDAGIIFIGPKSEVIHKMGNKNIARKLMAKNGIPIVPGTEKLNSYSMEEIKIFAEKIGYPVILKASGGGGGRGIRVVHKEQDLENAFESCKREALTYFNNDEVFMEKYVVNPRHIEFQILGDNYGNIIHLCERDCSIQRRHQKVIEIAPCPGISDNLRKTMGVTAVAAAKAVGYTNAGTIEFLLDDYNRFYFMEMNTRIQVEHPITEEITGIDLIVRQIRIAAGEILDLEQSDIKPRGFAIEARITAENVWKNFIPSPGKIGEYYPALGPSVRVDSHIYKDYTVPPYYDSMLAKLIIKATSYDLAVNKLERALKEFVIDDIRTTIPFLIAITKTREFRRGYLDTSFIETHMQELLEKTEDRHQENKEEVIAAIAATLKKIRESRE